MPELRTLLTGARLVPAGLARLVPPALALAVLGFAVPDALAKDVTVGMESISEERIARHVEVLASDEFEGRKPSTAGEEKTLEYIQGEFRRIGVVPAVDGSYLQPVPLVSKRVLDGTRASFAGPGLDQRLEVGESIILRTNVLEEQVVIEGSEVVFGGHGIVAPEHGWNDYEGVEVRGKTILLLLNDPGRTLGDTTFFKGKALSHYGTLTYKQEEAARQGAVATLFIFDPEMMQVPWETLAGSAKQERMAAVPGPNSIRKTDVSGLIDLESAKAVLDDTGYDYDELKERARVPGFRSIPLNAAFSAEIQSELGESHSNNVVGIIPGTARPEEYVLYTAHWDHVGVGEAVDGDSIYNGAVDNATGTAVLIEIAEAFFSLPSGPERSVVLIATTAEEQGLLGSYHYADHPIYPLERTAAVINMDALFPFGSFDGMTVVAMGSSELEEYLEAAAATQGRTLHPNPGPEHGAFFRSDHYPFAKKGVPALFAVGGPSPDPPPPAEVMEHFQKYVTTQYHKPADEYDAETWDLSGIVQDARIFFHTGYFIAMDDRFPNWYLSNEFRALRDEMLLGGPSAAPSP